VLRAHRILVASAVAAGCDASSSEPPRDRGLAGDGATQPAWSAPLADRRNVLDDPTVLRPYPERAPSCPRPCAAEAWPDPEVVTSSATSLGLVGFSANGRIQPHGGPTSYWFEYGTTTAYGQRTPVSEVPPRLSAFYRETWDKSLAGFQGGSGDALAWIAAPPEGGFVRYTEPTGDDYNHVDGIGAIHLAEWFYAGQFSTLPGAALGGNDGDLRDARIRLRVRGNGWQPNGSELLWWSQIDAYHGSPPLGAEPRYANWAFTGSLLTSALLTGNWENVEYRLWNDTNEWTYAGTNRQLEAELGRKTYVYVPLDRVLAHHDVDVFHVLAYVDVARYPAGSIDFDDLEIAYRNHSLLTPSNGGALVSAPDGADDPTALTDGWRNGPGRTWRGPWSGTSPQEIVYDLDDPVTITAVQLHQNAAWPSRHVKVLAWDGIAWNTLVEDEVPESDAAGPGFAYLLATGLSAQACRVKVVVFDGYREGFAGLGEIEVFGTGAKKRTDDDWYRVNADVTGLTPGQTYHYRLVAMRDGKTWRGQDMTFTVPATAKPEAVTGALVRGGGGRATVAARINTLGRAGEVTFEYGPTAAYGSATVATPAGPEITPRTVVGTLEGLPPGRTVHFRVVVTTSAGTSYGADAAFTAP
jgi:hypothetical protein